MYKLLHGGSSRELLQTELAPMFGAGVIAEVFFKWHSFTLECLGFLAVWYAFGWLLASLQNRRAIPGS
jgi:hypothetical protein